MMNRILKILILLVFLNGCSLYHYLTVSEFKNESAIEYNQFLNELNSKTEYSYQIKSNYLDSLSKNVKYCLNLYKFKNGTNASSLQLRMYKKSGELVMGWEQCYGNLNYFKLFDSIPLKIVHHLPNNYDLRIQNDLNLFNVDSLGIIKLKKYIDSHDYTIILFYTKWIGWYAKDAIKRTVKYANKNPNIALIYLNTANK